MAGTSDTSSRVSTTAGVVRTAQSAGIDTASTPVSSTTRRKPSGGGEEVTAAGARRPTEDSNSELTLEEATNAEAIAAVARTVVGFTACDSTCPISRGAPRRAET